MAALMRPFPKGAKEDISQVEYALVGTARLDEHQDEGLLDSGILDSFGLVEFIGFIESEFGIEVGEEEFTNDNFKDLTAIKKFVRRKLKQEN